MVGMDGSRRICAASSVVLKTLAQAVGIPCVDGRLPSAGGKVMHGVEVEAPAPLAVEDMLLSAMELVLVDCGGMDGALSKSRLVIRGCCADAGQT